MEGDGGRVAIRNNRVGVEVATGPLGQGVGNAVGYALSGKRAAARFNTSEHTIFDHHVVALAGDGCMQEGVAREAIAFAGHNGLDNLILIYDSNDVTLDAMAEVTQSEDAASYFKAVGWDAVTVDGHDLVAVSNALQEAKSSDNGKPKVIIAKTVIGKGIPEVAGSAAGHGEGGAKFAEAARQGLGLPEETFYVSEATREFFMARSGEPRVRCGSQGCHPRVWWRGNQRSGQACSPVGEWFCGPIWFDQELHQGRHRFWTRQPRGT